MDPNLFPKPDGIIPMHHRQSVLLLGSCFSTHLAERIQEAGFTVMSNPFGVVFHPVPMARFLIETLTGVPAERTLLRDDVYLSWDAGSEVYAMSEVVLSGKLHALRTEFLRMLETAQKLFITLGSAHGYCLKTTGEIVANCHKAPAAAFEKELTEPSVLLQTWQTALELLKNRYPKLEIVFTVSPVRYPRDGWIANNRSKARLFGLTEQLQTQFSAGYFPAFELVNDILRDYRYFETDGVHPNRQAIDEVWELFRSWYFNAETNKLVGEMEALRRMEKHRLLFPESVKSAEFKQQFNEKRESFLSLHPYILWR